MIATKSLVKQRHRKLVPWKVCTFEINSEVFVGHLLQFRHYSGLLTILPVIFGGASIMTGNLPPWASEQSN